MTFDLGDALLSRPPTHDDLTTFGRFVGDWDLEWWGALADGTPISGPGRLTFGWVLGGRAVQDVWDVPAASPGDPGIAGRGFCGTTVRFPDPSIGAWRSTWIEPINSRVRRFIGRPSGADAGEGSNITLLSVDGEPHLRWSFLHIEPDRFDWLGEASTDGGHTWTEEEWMTATRRAEGPG